MRLALLLCALGSASAFTAPYGVGIGGTNSGATTVAHGLCTAASTTTAHVFLGGAIASSSAAYSTLTSYSSTSTTSTSTQVHAATSTSNKLTSGFIEAIDATNGGARLWYAEITGSGGASVTAMTIGNDGSGSGDVLYLCGTFNSSDTTYVSPAGVVTGPFVSDATSSFLVVDNFGINVTNPMTVDVFTLALNAATGAVIFSGSIHSVLDDACYAVAYTSFAGGNVVFGGSAGGTYFPATLVPPFSAAPLYPAGTVNIIAEPSGVVTHDPQTIGGPVGYWLRVNSAGGGAAIAPTVQLSGQESQFGDWVTALAFDAYGVLYIGVNAWGDFTNGYIGDRVVQTGGQTLYTLKPAIMIVSSNAFAGDAAAASLIRPIWTTSINAALNANPTLYPPIIGVSAFGAAYGNDVITGLEVLQSKDAGNTVLAISGWTNGTVGSTFNASNYNWGNPSNAAGSDINDAYPAIYRTNKPSGLLPNANSAWLIVTNAYMNSSSATLTFLNPNAGVQAMSSGMARDPVNTNSLLLSVSLSGSGTFAGSSFSSSGQWDAALVSATTSGAVQTATIMGNTASNTLASGVAVAGTASQSWPFVSGSFSGSITVASSSSCPLTMTSAGAPNAFLLAFSAACPVSAASSSTAVAGNSSTAGGSAEVSQSSTAFGAAARATGSSSALVALASVAAAVAIALGAANREL